MEKEYVDALLNDLSKTYSIEEKFHLITVFVTELSNYQNKSTQAIEGVSETLIKIQKTFETLNDTNEKLFAKILDVEKRAARLEFNYDLPEKGRKTEIEQGFDNLYKGQNDILKIINKSLKSKIQSDEDAIKIYGTLSNILESQSSMADKISKLVDRIDKLEDK